LEAAPDVSRVEAAELDETRVVAVELDGSHAAEEAQAVTHAPVAASDATRVAEEAPLAGPAEAGSVAFPHAIAAEVAAGSLADALALQVVSAEFQADEKAVAASSAEAAEDGYCRASLVAALVDDCSPAVCLGTGAAAGLANSQTADEERCGC
jgi:fructoselysine-6-P-deglycase FrlB-like protein